MGKTVHESKFSEWKGLDRIQSIVHEMKCIWREISKDDFGLDGEIEVVVPKSSGKGFETMGNIIKVQAKSGSKYVVQDKPQSFSTPVEKADLEMWSRSNYPVLFIVYHPSEDKLYCKEIREFVRTTHRVFQPPLRVDFSKIDDLFDVQYFSKVKQHAGVGAARISFDQQEQFYSNLFPVRRLPSVFHAATKYESTEKLRDALAPHLPPVCVSKGRLCTFAELRDPQSAFQGACEGEVSEESADAWMAADPARVGDYTYMMNQLLGKVRWETGLRFYKDFERTYFPRENEEEAEFKRTWYNVRTNREVPERLTVKHYTYGVFSFWRHLACNLSFIRISDAWFLRIIPKYFFTEDGRKPCDPDLVGPFTTRLKAMEHNMQVLNHVLFWADVLSRGRDSISYKLGRRVIFMADKTPMTGIGHFAIPEDPATYEEKVPTNQLSLFPDQTERDDADD